MTIFTLVYTISAQSIFDITSLATAFTLYPVATVSFSQEEYTVREGEQRVTVSIVRSRNTTSNVVIMIASRPSEGSATGTYNDSSNY